MNRMYRVLSVAAAVALSMSTGCMGHGSHTGPQVSQAKEKMNAMKAATEWQTARQAFFGGDLNKALKHVNVSIGLNGDVAKSHVLKGRILMESSDLEGAAQSFERAEALEPDNVEAQYYQGTLYERLGQKDLARERYLKAAELDAANPQYAIAAAEMMIDLGKLEQAEGYLRSRRAAFQHNAGVRQTLGHIATMKGDHAAAATLFNEARLLAPDDLAILEDYARAQFENKEYAESEYALGKVLVKDENGTRRDLRLMRAECLMKLDRLVEARTVLADMTRQGAGASDAAVWVQFGQVSYKMKDFPRVKVAASRVIAIDPKRPEGYMLRALFAKATGDLALAESSLVESIQARPTSDAWLLLGVVQRDQNKSEASQRSFQEAGKLDPTIDVKGMISEPGGK